MISNNKLKFYSPKYTTVWVPAKALFMLSNIVKRTEIILVTETKYNIHACKSTFSSYHYICIIKFILEKYNAKIYSS